MPRMRKKSEAVTVAGRVEELLRLRIDGAQHRDIVQYAAEKGWGLKDRQLRNYTRRAGELLAARQQKGRRLLMGLHVARREYLYSLALVAADYRTALAILADLASLQSLYTSGRDLKEMARTAAKQDERIEQLENLLREVVVCRV